MVTCKSACVHLNFCPRIDCRVRDNICKLEAEGEICSSSFKSKSSKKLMPTDIHVATTAAMEQKTRFWKTQFGNLIQWWLDSNWNVKLNHQVTLDGSESLLHMPRNAFFPPKLIGKSAFKWSYEQLIVYIKLIFFESAQTTASSKKGHLSCKLSDSTFGKLKIFMVYMLSIEYIGDWLFQTFAVICCLLLQPCWNMYFLYWRLQANDRIVKSILIPHI